MRPEGDVAEHRPGSQLGPPAGSIRRVLILADVSKEAVRAFAPRLVEWLEARVEQVETQDGGSKGYHLERDLRRDEPAPAPEREVDLVVVLGGDGAILGAVRAFAEKPVPTLGINFGHVGFLASTPASQWAEVLEGVLAGRGVLEPRMRLSAEVVSGESRYSAVALNDLVVLRGSHQGMLETRLAVEDVWVTDYRSDGLIVSTPSGSTAYSLSAGGAILAPSMQAIGVTPICSQGLANRPIVLPPESVLSVDVLEAGAGTALVVDGQDHCPMAPGDSVRVQRHPELYPLLRMPDLDPYRRLRERLGWRGSL